MLACDSTVATLGSCLDSHRESRHLQHGKGWDLHMSVPPVLTIQTIEMGYRRFNVDFPQRCSEQSGESHHRTTKPAPIEGVSVNGPRSPHGNVS